MKITRKQIRRIVTEEANRELPISYYSDDMLMQEGILDFLKGLFGPLLDFFKGAYSEAEQKVQGVWDDVTSQVTNTAKEVMGDAGEKIKSLTDLDMGDEKQKKVWYKVVAPAGVDVLKGAEAKLKSAADVKDWTPADDTEEAAKKWQDENGEAAQGVWYAFGVMGGTMDYLADAGAPAADKLVGEYETVSSSGNPGEAIKYIMAGAVMLDEIGSGAKKEVGDDNGLQSAAAALKSSAESIGKAIADSGKEQQKENLELRKMINQMIIQERKIIKGNSGR
jgi:hypothetical protein|tara:strand:+ start:1566 stop:2402 length:837 start_codon:yes stop_codon:yes gene_type:complete